MLIDKGLKDVIDLLMITYWIENDKITKVLMSVKNDSITYFTNSP